ncbi:MAG: chemotaxis protein CheA, partial [Bryobacteraceae bacterium]
SSEQCQSTLDQGIQRLREVLRAAAHEVPESAPIPPPQIEARHFSLADDPELLADFVLESREHLESIEAQLLALEHDARHMEAIHSVFRSFHTIKGLAGFLELPLIQEVAHEVETLLDLARQSALEITPEVIDVVLESKDYLGRWLKHLDQTPSASLPFALADNRKLIARIHALSNSGHSPEAITAPKQEHDVRPPETHPTAREEKPSPEAAATIDSSAATQTRGETKKAGRAVKVDTDKLDHLVDMVGEMVVAQSLVRHDPELNALKNTRLMRNLAQMARITDEVQRTAMSMRMVPIGPLFQKMARLVRDLKRKVGKQAYFVSAGEDVQLDRNIVEEIADPLMHMVRNSVDHGIESATERRLAGKEPQARIELRAFHSSGQIVIQIADDGKGIDREKILEKARSKGLIAPSANLSDSECFNMIFHPGFSTADQISDVSGRGVGMDVVKKQIQKLRGSIEIESVRGQGTTFSLRLPLTLAIIDGLIVLSGAERYIIPLASVKEMFRPTPGMVTTVEGRSEVVLVRDRVLPVIRLYERFGTEPRSKEPSECVLVVAEFDSTSFCLMVDELIGKQEFVIKSLGPVFQQVEGVAGGAILGDGHIGLILDMKGIFGERSDA